MKVLYIAAECKPFSKVGGVGDVAGELPTALKAQGIDIEIVTPFYGTVDSKQAGKKKQSYTVHFNGKEESVEIYHTTLDGVRVNLIKNPTYFEGKYAPVYIDSKAIPFRDDALRFSFFCEACLPLVKNINPDIVHVNDWGMCYLLGRMVMEDMPQKRVLTIHNIGYQGNIGKSTIHGWQMESICQSKKIGYRFNDPHTAWNSVNPLRLGLELAHMSNTVSPTYKEEITKPEVQKRYFEGGKGLHRVTRKLSDNGQLIGILNGFVYKHKASKKRFSEILKKKSAMKAELGKDFANPNGFLLGFVGRAVEQKFKLLAEQVDSKSVLEHILDIPEVNVAMVATGEHKYEKIIRGYSKRNNFSATIAFDRVKAPQISLGSDVFLMPSLFEPCGITQMESLSNATPPLVRWIGGLVDTVKPHTAKDGNGFGFDGSTGRRVLQNLISVVKEAVEVHSQNNSLFRELQQRGYEERFLWSDSAERYVSELYEPAMR